MASQRDGSQKLQADVAGTLANLAIIVDNKVCIANPSSTPELLTLSSNGNDAGRQAARALFGLLMDTANKSAIAEAEELVRRKTKKKTSQLVAELLQSYVQKNMCISRRGEVGCKGEEIDTSRT